MHKPETRLNLESAAAYQGLAPGTIRGWIKKKQPIPDHFRVGKLYQFEIQALDKFLEERKVESVRPASLPKGFEPTDEPGF